MKIDEFIEKLNELGSLRAERDNDLVRFYSKHSADDEYFFIINCKYDSFEDAYADWDCLDDDVDPVDLCEALNLANEFLNTPIDERFPEKKYRLMAMRYVEGPIAIKQYVTSLQASGDYVTFDFGSKENAEKWTDKELHNMSQWFPQEAIDAMKEPVEED